MKKQKLNQILIVTVTTTLILIVLGIVFQQSEHDQLNGFTSVYAVSNGGDIAYVNYNKGESEIFIYDQEEPIAMIEASKEIRDIKYSIDNQSLIYVVSNRDMDAKKIRSTIYKLDIKTKAETELFRDNKIITEIALDSKDEQMIYYLGATSYENYSPIARSAPHNFDIYSYSKETEEINRHTKLDKYGITSLQISSIENIAYIQMDDDLEAETAEDIFESTQKVFSVPLDKPEQLSVFDFTNRVGDIHDMFYIEEEDMVVYQAVSGDNDKGNFQYDLYIVDIESNIEKQLTDLNYYTAQPIYSPEDKKIYFIIDTQFAAQEPNYELYRINLERTNIEQLQLN